MTRPFGFSQKTVTQHCSPSTNATIQPTNTRTGASENCSAAPVKKSYCEQSAAMLDLFGEISMMPAAKKASTARSSETKANTSHLTLSDRLTPSLISHGLVAGITPMSTRQQCGAAIPDIASYGLDGNVQGTPKAGCLSCGVTGDTQ